VTSYILIRGITYAYTMLLRPPASLQGNGPTLSTLIEVGQVLEQARREPPLSLAEIGRRMRAKRVRHSTLRASVDFMERLGLVTIGRQGVQWTHTRDARFWAAARQGRPLGARR